MTAGLFKQLTQKSVIESLEKLVQERGENWRYPENARHHGGDNPEWRTPNGGGCRYFGLDGKTPRCPVGYVFAEHGIDAETLDGLMFRNFREGIEVNTLLAEVPIITDDQDIIDGLTALQQANDGGDTLAEGMTAFYYHVSPDQ